MQKIKPSTYVGERALYHIHDSLIENCVFEDGESPLKECHNLEVKNTEFRWKYPMWYSENINCEKIKILESARSGVWYTKNITIKDSIMECPKYFRKCQGVKLINTNLPHALETFWDSKDILIKDVRAKGDYLCFRCENVEVDNLYLEGNYAFDSCKNVTIRNSILNSKDSFWNVENAVIINCRIIGEYLGWNSKNLTFIDCAIESNQGLCYIDKLVLKNTRLDNTDLCFELCSGIDAEVVSHVISIKNPISGRIKVQSVEEIILDKEMIDPTKTEIIMENE